MNLQEHIRKVLKENHTDKMIKLIDNYIKTFYFDYATYREYEKELQLNREIFYSLEGIFGDNMDYVVDWFNYNFGEDAEYVTF